jgi:hypothetical protein
VPFILLEIFFSVLKIKRLGFQAHHKHGLAEALCTEPTIATLARSTFKFQHDLSFATAKTTKPLLLVQGTNT